MKNILFCLTFIFAALNSLAHNERCFSAEHRTRLLKEARSNSDKRKLLKRKIERIIGSVLHNLSDSITNPHKVKAAHKVLASIEDVIRKELECSNVHDVVQKIAHFAGHDTIGDAINAQVKQLDKSLIELIENYNSLYWAAAWYVAVWDDEQCLSAAHIKNWFKEAQKDPKKFARLKTKLEKISSLTLRYLGDYFIQEKRRDTIALMAINNIECLIEDELHCKHAHEVTKALLKKYGFEDVSQAFNFGIKQLSKSIDHVIHDGFNLGKLE